MKMLLFLLMPLLMTMVSNGQSSGYRGRIYYGTLEEQRVRYNRPIVPIDSVKDTAIINFRRSWEKCCGWMDRIHLFNMNFDLYPMASGEWSALSRNLDSLDLYDSLYECTIRCHYNADSAKHYKVMRTFYFLESQYYWVIDYGVDDLKKHLTTKDSPDAKKIKSKCSCETNQNN